MKNIHLISTNKPSRLFEILQFNFVFDNQNKYSEEYKKLHKYKNQNIYITNSEEIKINEPYLGNDNNIYYLCEGGVNFKGKKVILTTDNQLIKDGVQAIDDEFLEWFVKNPSCEFVELEVDLSKHNGQFQTKYGWKIIIPEEEPKQETLEEAAHNHQKGNYDWQNEKRLSFIAGSKWQAERMYSEEEVYSLLEQSMKDCHLWELEEHYSGDYKNLRSWFEQFKKK
jgi:hypothetical protein